MDKTPIISNEKLPNGQIQIIAKDPVSRVEGSGDTKEDALRILRIKNNTVNTFQSEYDKAYPQQELDSIILPKIKKDIGLIYNKLKAEGAIIEESVQSLSHRVLLNHCKLVIEELECFSKSNGRPPLKGVDVTGIQKPGGKTLLALFYPSKISEQEAQNLL